LSLEAVVQIVTSNLEELALEAIALQPERLAVDQVLNLR
jgi:hypothetical protein